VAEILQHAYELRLGGCFLSFCGIPDRKCQLGEVMSFPPTWCVHGSMKV
jgi:hypothetical protein